MLGHKRIPSREGGIEVVVEELSKRLVKKGYEVTCYNRSGKHVLDKDEIILREKEYEGIYLKNVFTIDLKGLAAVSSSFFGTIRILFSKADIVHYHAEGPCVWMWIIKKFSKKKIIVTIHGLDWKRAKWHGFASKFIRIGEKCAVKYADFIIVLSENVRKYFRNEYKRDTVYIPNGVNSPSVVKPNIIKKKNGLNGKDYILYLGRIVPEKGIHYLIDAYNNLSCKKKLVIAGAASDTNDYYLTLKEKAKDNNNIIFTGFVQGKELSELYSSAYIYVLPSDLEGMPLSLLEAMSYGNCCLTSDIPECKDVINNNGFVFKKSNISDLEKMISYLCDNPDVVKEYRKMSKNYVLSKYNWDFICSETIKLYEKDR